MDNLFSEAAPLLFFLLPGFLCAWIFYGLASHPKPGQFERTVEALVFTFVVHAAVRLVEYVLVAIGQIWSIGLWTATSQLVWSALLAVLLGVIVASAVNRDTFHTWLRKRNLTSRTSHPSEWFCVLDSNTSLLILHLTDGRRLTGWPKEWPVEPSEGQFYLLRPAWISEDGGVVELHGLDGILIHANEVRWIEITSKQVNSDVLPTQRVESAPAAPVF